eukprot:1147577-Pelagomonas_calceolata.AAC.4
MDPPRYTCAYAGEAIPLHHSAVPVSDRANLFGMQTAAHRTLHQFIKPTPPAAKGQQAMTASSKMPKNVALKW